MINILINGANGKMGKKVFESAQKNTNVKAVCGVDIARDCSNPAFPIYDSFDKVKEPVDVVIDFSAPACLDNILSFCTKNNLPAILCSTGYSNEQIRRSRTSSVLDGFYPLVDFICILQISLALTAPPLPTRSR